MAAEEGPTGVDRPDRSRGVRSWLGRHPIVALALLSPGIPEYLSSSSPLNAIVLAPPQFVFQLVANLGLYLPGVLLVREAQVRWRKGWATVVLLGAAYGILEEGIGLSTMFNAHASVVGRLGSYGHWAGVNWVWIPGVVLVHVMLSISLPILLFGLALPARRGRSLLGRSGLRWAIGILCADVLGLALLVRFGEHFWMGWPQLAGAVAAVASLVLLARWAPAEALRPPRDRPSIRPVVAFLLGFAFFPAIIVPEGLLAALGVAPILTIVAVVLAEAALLLAVRAGLGRSGNARPCLAFALGALLPIAAIGVIAELPLPLTLGADAALAWFFWEMFRKYPRSEPFAERSVGSA